MRKEKRIKETKNEGREKWRKMKEERESETKEEMKDD